MRLLPVGKKAVDFLKRRKYPFTAKCFAGILGGLKDADGREVARFSPRSSWRRGRRRLHGRQRVPIDPVAGRANREAAAALREDAATSKGPAGPAVDFLYEPDPPSILAGLLPRYLEFTVYRALVESAAAEMGARMTAMDSATKNAWDMIDRLTLISTASVRRSITKEMIEIVSGAAAPE